MKRATVLRLVSVFAASLTLASGTSVAAEQEAGEAQALKFSRDVQPILSANCMECHGPDRKRAGIGFESAASAMAEAESGEPAIVPREPEHSELIRRITADDPDVRMPPDDKEPLSEAEISLLRQWIEQGAQFEPHWAFTPPQRPEPPDVSNEDWVRNPIDRFILAELEEAGFEPSPEADRYTLVRRLYFDLLGFAPTPAEADAFVEDEREDAYERLVDELLASPHFGERWGRHWLDLARYADSDGFERDYWRPGAWRWRDWVIDSVNADQPFDQFITEQLAGDLLQGATPRQQLATGFFRAEPHNTEGGIDVEESAFRKAVGQLNAVGTAMMGLTVACAECHTHKYDPIEHDAYYQMLAFFWGQLEERDVPADAFYEDASDRGRGVHFGARGNDDLKDYLARDWVHVAVARGDPRPTHVRIRGDFHELGEQVQPGVPAVLGELEPRDPQAGADRLDLARWLTSGEHPLTARVAVNQFWAKLMGEGLVRTLEDFGLQGERPTHPELLDYLAEAFVASGWSRKQMVRQIVTSSTYRQASAYRSDLAAVDPENRLWARQTRRRVEAEAVRDHALRAAGLLVRQVGGPGYQARIPEDMENLGWGQRWEADGRPEVYRRGVYMMYRRNTPVPMLPVFDAPETSTACPEREISQSPLQTLTLWNGPVFVEAAQTLGVRTASRAGKAAEQAQWLWRRGLTRPASEQELAVLVDVYQGFREEYEAEPSEAAALLADAPVEPDEADVAEAAAWTATARMLLGMDPTITRE